MAAELEFIPVARDIVIHIMANRIDRWIDEQSGMDLRELLRRQVELIGQMVKRQLDQRDMEIMAQQAAALQSSFELYAYGRPKERLEQLNDHAHQLTFQAERFAFRAVSTYAIAGGLELVGAMGESW